MLKPGKPYLSYTAKDGAWLKVWSCCEMANTWLKLLCEVFLFIFFCRKRIAVFWMLLSFFFFFFPQPRENVPLSALLWVSHHTLYSTEGSLFRNFYSWKSGKARIIWFSWNPNPAVRQHSNHLWPCPPESLHPQAPPFQVKFVLKTW